MATIHPSRSGIVPEVKSSDGEIDRERELREKLRLSRQNRNEDGAGSSSRNDNVRLQQRRESPSYDRYSQQSYGREPPPPSRNRDQYDRPPPIQYNPRVPPPGWQGDDEQRPPPPGAWGRRQEGGRSAPMQGGGYQENRDAQRKASTFVIWPASPTSPYHSSDGEARRKSSSKHKSSKRRSHKSHKYSDEEDSEAEERRRRRKRREMERSRATSEVDSEEEERRRRRRRREREKREEEEDRHRSRSHKGSHRRSRSERDDSDGGSDVKRARKSKSKEKETTPVERSPSRALISTQRDTSEPSEVKKEKIEEGRSRVAVRIGPQLPPSAVPEAKDEGDRKASAVDHRAYGKALLPGEGSAMANFVQEGKRIPRRGEIGLSSDQIESFEQVGYVMSGSRHARMNAVRMRKENQIISAEEQRSILKMRGEEKQKKEAEIIAQVGSISIQFKYKSNPLLLQFKDMVDSMQ
jgi:hypothetical protein